MKQNVTIYMFLFLLVTAGDFSFTELLNNQPSKGTNFQKSDHLAVDSSNSILVIPMLKSTAVTSNDLQRATVIQANDYHAQVFSISYKDNLILYGKDSIFAKPIESGDNFLNVGGVKNLEIGFDEHFTVDWADYNVYAFKQRSLTVHSLLAPQYSVVVYNGSMKVRNIELEYDRHFLTWISNDNNIMKSGKDGSFPLNLWTEKSGTVHCMTLSPVNDRIYYATLGRSVKNVQVEVHKEKDVVKEIQSFDVYFVFIYSIDYNSKFEPPVKEVTFEVNSSWTKVISMTRYYKELFFITLDFEHSEDGAPMPKKNVEENKKNPDTPGPFSVYRLWKFDRGPTMLKEDRHFPMTSVMVAWYNPGNTSLCKQKNCPQICMSTDSNTVKCYCKDYAQSCQSIHPPLKKIIQSENSSNSNLSVVVSVTEGNGVVAAIDIKVPQRRVTEKKPSSVFQNPNESSFLSKYWIIATGVIFLILAVLLFTGYRRYCSSSPTDETSDSTIKSTLSKIGKDTAEMFDITLSSNDGLKNNLKENSTDKTDAEDPSNNQNTFMRLIKTVFALFSTGNSEKVEEIEETTVTNEIIKESLPKNEIPTLPMTSVPVENDVLPVKKKIKKKNIVTETTETTNIIDNNEDVLPVKKKKKKKNKVTETTDDNINGLPVKKKKKKKKKKLNQGKSTSDSQL